MYSSYQKDKRAKPGNLPKKHLSFGNCGELNKTALSFVISLKY
jgi:hypothetical protein